MLQRLIPLVLAALCVASPAHAVDKVACRTSTGAVTTCPGNATLNGTLTVNGLTVPGGLAVQGFGAAGTPTGDVLTVQGDPAGTPIPISGTISLPTGAATAAKQDTGNASLSSIAATVSAISALQLPAALVSGRLDVNLGAVGVTVPVSGTFWQATQPVSGPLTDTQLRASAVSVSGPLTDTQLRASAVPVSAASLPLPTGAATETTLAKLTQTQGSATSGQSGPLAQAAVTTSAPTYSDGTTAPLSLTAGGALRVAAIGSTVNPASINITTRDLASTSTSGQNGQTIVTGTPTANSAATFALQGVSTIRPQVSGTWTGTLTSELSMDGGTTYYPIAAHLTGTPLSTSTFTANGQGSVNVGSATHYRLRATAAITGTAVITVAESAQVGTVNVANAIRLIDSTTGSTTQANVVAASTAVPSTATSLSVGLNPNSPTPKFADGTCSGTLTNGSPTLTCSSLQGVSAGAFHLAYGASGSISVACSYDDTNYSSAIPMAPPSAPSTTVTSVSTSGDWLFAASACNAIRFTLTGGSGSHTVTARFTGTPPPTFEETSFATAANQTSGAQKTQQVDASGNVQPAGDSVTRPIYQARVGASAFQLLTGLTAGTTLRSGVGTLRKMCVFIPSSGGSGGFYVYDNTAASGTAIVSLFTTTSTCYDIDARFATGLTVQMTTTAATVLMTWDTY